MEALVGAEEEVPPMPAAEGEVAEIMPESPHATEEPPAPTEAPAEMPPPHE
jgi:hypothetical protein